MVEADVVALNDKADKANDSGDGGPETDLTGDCPITSCGLNGTWLGSGVPFRTLHLSPYRHNEVNLSLLEARGPKNELLKITVDRDVLSHTDGATSTPIESGTVLHLGRPATPGLPLGKAGYEIRINDVRSTGFWVCPDAPGNPPSCGGFPVYEFTAKDLEDDCEVEVCKPGLDPDNPNSLVGTAVIFRGDYYSNAYTVRTTPASDYDDDLFNIACLGTDISKLHLLRHTSASRADATTTLPPAVQPPAVEKRQAMLKLLAADYCGIGVPFTKDGTPIRFGFDDPGMHLVPASGFSLDPAPAPPATVEAFWNEQGATCIGTPRLGAAQLARISEICTAAGHALPLCSTAFPAAVAPSFSSGRYAISQNHPAN